MEHLSNASMLEASSMEPVALNIGGKMVYTTVGSLVDRSGYFTSLFSGRWSIKNQEDGSIFIDADPKVFAHILSYLRHGIFPLCYDPETGHDHKLYAEILAEAKYYQVPKLEVWLTNRCYSKAVNLMITTSRAVPWEEKIACLETFTDDETVSFEQAGVLTEPKFQCKNFLWTKHTSICNNCGGSSQDDIPTECLIGEVQMTLWRKIVRKTGVQEGWCSDSGKEFEEYWKGLVRSGA
ncbi:hypothetical protein CONLIGDRAFT_679067 [Coniochaeta ligniaria NRRL 30616]|uniref:BTB domain-containing protein n=1 Tax=Coniochaeta ligniaria NRRL 30616 TaxID=1408157 RepID=A0A1J7JXY7_9PEZI|nr:hypothetical protein CONLIGDRAFT_679067 [Coniochaeta ligniaria NRRL 30616]